MIYIYKNLITNYINNNLSIDDIKEYALKSNINLSHSDTIIIYNFIKRNYKNILDGDESSFNNLKLQINKDLYDKIIKIYNYYKSKLLS